jgi:S1-C subfamily serine protease
MRLRTVLLVVLVLFCPAVVVRGQGLESLENEIADLIERVRPSVVKVRAVSRDVLGGKREVTVSGVVLDDRGTIVTLGSAVLGAESVEVELQTGKVVKARVLGVDERMNLGILEAPPAELVSLPVAASSDLRVGAFALVIGNPFGLTGSAGLGIVSGLQREVQGVGLGGARRKTVVYYDLIQTTAPINPGDSGGALVDSKGRLIGMISATFGRSPSVERIREMLNEFARSIDLAQVEGLIAALDLTEQQQAFVRIVLERFKSYQKSIESEGEAARPTVYEGMPEGIPGASLGAQGINFAVPADQVYYAARMIRAHGSVVRLGVRVDLPAAETSSQAGLSPGQGLVITEVAPESPAARAGLRKHDILLAVAGRPVGHPRELRRALVASPVKEALELRVLRRGVEIVLSFRY